jgi:hypothetical protein
MLIPNFDQNNGGPFVGVANPSNISPTALVVQESARVKSGDIRPYQDNDGNGNPVRVVILEGRYLGDTGLSGDAYYVADVQGNVFDLLQLVIGEATNAKDEAAAAAARAQL